VQAIDGTGDAMTALALALALAWDSVVGHDPAPPTSPADAILAQLDRQREPVIGEFVSTETYYSKVGGYWKTRIPLVHQLYKVDPGNSRLPGLFLGSWQHSGSAAQWNQATAILQANPSSGLLEVAHYIRATILLSKLSQSATDVQVAAVAQEMTDTCLYSSYAPDILYACARRMKNPANRLREYRLIAQLYPGFGGMTQVEAQLANWEGRQQFELDFKDACTGKPASVCAVRGKVLLVYFSPSPVPPKDIATLYDRYHADGLVTIGVVSGPNPESTPWPLVADSEQAVMRSWGVTRFPTVFLVDKEGRLSYTNPDNPEGRIKELLSSS